MQFLMAKKLLSTFRGGFSTTSLNVINKQIIVISGSLRKASYTTAVCRALVKQMNETHKTQAGNSIEFVLRDYVRELPTYDGDLDINTDTQTPPAVVVDFRRELSEAHAVIIGTPEYNYNVPGGLKNVIDWASRPFAKHCLRLCARRARRQVSSRISAKHRAVARRNSRRARVAVSKNQFVDLTRGQS
jgi:NAD(P)H-dependent FMN reductase